MAKPGVWRCVQARERWSPEEEVHMRPVLLNAGFKFDFAVGNTDDSCFYISLQRIFVTTPQHRSAAYSPAKSLPCGQGS